MNFSFVVLVFTYYRIFIDQLKSVSAANGNLQIIEDERTVADLVAKYIKYKRGFKSKIKRPFPKIHKDICDKTPDVKKALCHRFLFGSMVYFGYKLNSRGGSWICEEKTFYLTNLNNEETDSFKLQMYRCPRMMYNDLETGTEKSIDDRYFVSKGRHHDSAIVFLRINELANIQPKNYIHNIAFNELISLQAVNEYQFAQIQIPPGETTLDDRSKILEYGEVKKLPRTYEKFKRLFRSMNVCSLLRSHKIHVCRESITYLHNRSAQLQSAIYDRYLCKKYQVRAPVEKYDFREADNTELDLYLLRCPLWKPKSNEKTIDDAVYIGSHLLYRSVNVLTKTNDWDEKFEWSATFYDIGIREIVYDKRRTRAQPYPSERGRRKKQRNYLREFEDEANFVNSSLQMPITMAKSIPELLVKVPYTHKKIPVTRADEIVEDHIISFSEIKVMKFVYVRFRLTHKSLDICQLPYKVKASLCDNVLKGPPFRYYNEPLPDDSSDSIEIKLKNNYNLYPPEEINSACSRHVINLSLREIDSLQAKYFSLWTCPKSEPLEGQPARVYYIGKSHLTNALMIFIKGLHHYGRDEVIFPIAVATKIDRDDLARIILSWL